MLKKFFAAAAVAGLMAAPVMADDELWPQYNTNQVTITVEEIAELAWQQNVDNDAEFTITNFDGGVEPASEQRTVFFMTNVPAHVDVSMDNGDIPNGTTLNVWASSVNHGAKSNLTATWARNNDGIYTTDGDGTTLFECFNVVAANPNAAMFDDSGSAVLNFTAHNTNGLGAQVATDTATLRYTIIAD